MLNHPGIHFEFNGCEKCCTTEALGFGPVLALGFAATRIGT
jgi:hypothetical protein